MEPGPYSGQILLQAARSLATQIVAAADEVERQRRLPDSLVATLRNGGLYRMLVPRSVGGAELTLSEFAEVIEELARADASVAWCVAQNSGVCGKSGYLPPEGLREVFGDRDTILSWGNGPTSALKVPGGYRLTGRWIFSSGIRNATWTGAHNASVIDEHGDPAPDESGQPRLISLFFPIDEAELFDVWQVSGLRGTGSDTYSVTDLFVPDHRVAMREPQEPGTLYRFNTTNMFSAGFAAVALGVARGAQDALLDLAVSKSPRGMDSALGSQQYAQIRIAKAEATLRSARDFLFETARRSWERVEESRVLDMETRINLRLATTDTIQRCAEVVDNAYHLAGSTAILGERAFERRFRDMHAITQHFQARDDHFQRVGQFMLGQEPDPTWL